MSFALTEEQIACMTPAKRKAYETAKKYREANKEKLKEKYLKYYQANKEKAKARTREWLKNNRERRRIYAKQYVEKNHTQENARWTAWRKANPDRMRERRRRWAENNPEKDRAAKSAWAKRNPEAVAVTLENRRTKKLGAGGRCAVEQAQQRIDFYGRMCAYCRVRPFQDLDHVIPLARGGTNWPANLRPACKKCNRSKSAKLLSEWSGPPALKRAA